MKWKVILQIDILPVFLFYPDPVLAFCVLQDLSATSRISTTRRFHQVKDFHKDRIIGITLAKNGI